MIDKNKTYRTRDGREVRIYATDGQSQFPIHGAININGEWLMHLWNANGGYKIDHREHSFDLIEVVPLIERWLVVRKLGGVVVETHTDLVSARNSMVLRNPSFGNEYQIVHLREVRE
jgi:hypothetical protein